MSFKEAQYSLPRVAWYPRIARPFTWIGLPYDPGLAKAMLAEAGYLHGHGFPAVTALTPLRSDDAVSEALAAQWREVLGVEVAWENVSPGLYLVLDKTPPNIFLSYWHADYPDPDDF